MHIPPYYKRKSWQRFFVGTFFGAVIAYCILLFMYGTMYEQLVEQNLELQSDISELKVQNKALLKDKENLNQQSKESNTVETIEIDITNEEELKLDKLIVHQLEELVKEEISHIVGQDIRTVYDSNQLLMSTIQNKRFRVDEMTYTFTVETLLVSETVELTIEADVEG